ncbi:glycoside hydrolase family 127 protein [Jiulongibacter sediminis]|nr:glycoside hydrolase family 127 protein [Jiulongibacter sediminis]
MKIAFNVGYILISLISTLPSAAQLLPFRLGQVEILEGPFKNAEQRNKEYLLKLDADRLLAPFYKNAGLTPKAENYGNWENTGLDGHVGGHYVSALAMMKAATGDKEISKRFDYVLKELKKCQEAAGNGMLTGVVNGKKVFGEVSNGDIRATSFGLNDGWVPLYNQHKIFAGLKDAYEIGESELGKTMFIDLCNWFFEITKNLTDEQIQNMLRSEHGGLNEVFLDAYSLTGEQKFLELAYRFSHQTLLKPLAKGEDPLTGMHANTQIPKVVGFAKIGDTDKNADYLTAAQNFWNKVVNERSVAIGGNSVREHFHPKDDFSTMISSEQGPENCNTYNMLRLSKALYFNEPQAKYIDYYERALYNNILSSIHPEKGGFVYFNPMRPNHYRVYSSVQEDFWCCVGSGIENHGKYGEMVYAHNGDNLYVHLFIASKLDTENGLVLTQKTCFPYEQQTQFELTLDSPKAFSLFLRKPEWLEATEIFVNEEKINPELTVGQYFKINRTWKNGDVIRYALPLNISLEKLPDDSNWGAFKAGPIVLAAEYEAQEGDNFFGDGSRMGHVAKGKLIPVYEAPAVLDATGDYTSHLKPQNQSKLTYELTGLSTGKPLTLKPYLAIHEKRYQVYFQLSNPDDFEKQQAEQKAVEEKQLALEKITVDRITLGEQQPESDHFFKDGGSYRGLGADSYYRSTWGSISYQLKAGQKVKRLLLVMNDLIANRAMEVWLNGNLLDQIAFDQNEPENRHEVSILLPKNLRKLNQYILEIKAVDGKHSPAITDIRLLKK